MHWDNEGDRDRLLEALEGEVRGLLGVMLDAEAVGELMYREKVTHGVRPEWVEKAVRDYIERESRELINEALRKMEGRE